MKTYMVSVSFVIILLNICRSVYSVELKWNGGYSVNVAINNSVPEPIDPQKFKNDFKDVVQAFSNQMEESTNKTFYIRLVNLLVPNHWVKFHSRIVAVDFHYKTADIRVSDLVKSPTVDNPYLCGLPGNYMELPLHYFTEIQSPEFGHSYGFIPKLMLTKWARLRWGVWEEFGFPENRKHPYFFKISGTDNPWKQMGCSDKEISGEFISRTNSSCNVTTEEEPMPDCRFYPAGITTATTSLMTHVTLASINQFCDESNHDKILPNRQNIYCGRSSVWKIIRETSDFKTVNGITKRYPVWVNVMKRSDKPLFYMLLDNRQTVPQIQFTAFRKSLNDIWGYIPELNVCALGSFPSNATAGQHIQEEVYWRQIGMAGSIFKTAMKTITKGENTHTDFALALQQKVDELKELNYPSGAVILIIKAGSDKCSFERTGYEQELLTSLLGTKITIFAIEYETANLNQTASVSNGIHVLLSLNDSVKALNAKMDPLRQHLLRAISEPISESHTNIEIHKKFMEPDEVFTLGVDNYDMAEFYLTTTNDGNIWKGFKFTTSNESVEVNTQVRSEDEWSGSSVTNRKTYILKANWSLHSLSTVSISYFCSGRDEDVQNKCKGFLVVRARNIENATQNIDVEISTNAINNFVDLDTMDARIGPFAIFVKVNVNRKPVRRLTVEAIVRQDNSIEDTLTLKDDGMGHPDISENDGIYSAYYIPRVDGPHKISVTVQNENSVIYIGDHEEISKLISEECTNTTNPDLHCNYDTMEIVETFYRRVDLASPIIFKNKDKFKLEIPLRILDLRVEALGNVQVEVGFTSPWTIDNTEEPADYYQIQYGGSPNDLQIFKSEGSSIVPRISSPGLLEMYKITLENHPRLSRITYFTVRSFRKDVSGELLSSELSNIGVAWTTPSEALPDNVELTDPLFTSTGFIIIVCVLILMIAISVTACVLFKFRTESVNLNSPI